MPPTTDRERTLRLARRSRGVTPRELADKGIRGSGRIDIAITALYTQRVDIWMEACMATATREITINLRALAAQKDLIDRAAEAQGKKRSEFMLEAACEKAEQVLLDKTFFALDPAHFRRFSEILDAPVQNRERLARLLATRAPWDR